MVQESDFTKFLQQHEAQLLASGVLQHFWHSLHIKLKNQIFDASNILTLLQIDYEGEPRTPEDPLWVVQITSEDGIKCLDKKHIYLVDHAWTFRSDQAKKQLLEMKRLLDRMCGIMGVKSGDDETRASEVCRLMWKYCQTYSVGNAASVENRLPVWYIMDEVGSAIGHSDDPSFRAVPFFYTPEQITYTLIFPVKDLQPGDLVTRDYVENIGDECQREAHLVPWKRVDLSGRDFRQDEPDEGYFLAGHVKESLPEFLDPQPPSGEVLTGEEKIINSENELENQFCSKLTVGEVLAGEQKILKVYSEYELVNQFLTDPRFEVTPKEEEGTILWYTHHFKTYAELSRAPSKFINQFPFENVLTIKDLLSIICRRKSDGGCHDPLTLETPPVWFPTTYNLRTELVKLISYFQNREKLGLDNHWICKPWNLARSLDTHITDNLDYIVRLNGTGPKIAQKYIHDPVVFNRPECGRVKFDVRYVLLLKSVAPLKAYVYKNFFLRFSNKPFSLSDFEDYQKHFTVMNYSDEAQLHHLPCADFLKQWQEQYPNDPWEEVEGRILVMLREVLEAATSVGPPRGVAPSPQSRAVYAVDIILSWDSLKGPQSGSERYMQPKLLEINWTPDCKRACDYYPNFYNDIFSCLFLDDESSNMFISL